MSDNRRVGTAHLLLAHLRPEPGWARRRTTVSRSLRMSMHWTYRFAPLSALLLVAIATVVGCESKGPAERSWGEHRQGRPERQGRDPSSGPLGEGGAGPRQGRQSLSPTNRLRDGGKSLTLQESGRSLDPLYQFNRIRLDRARAISDSSYKQTQENSLAIFVSRRTIGVEGSPGRLDSGFSQIMNGNRRTTR